MLTERSYDLTGLIRSLPCFADDALSTGVKPRPLRPCTDHRKVGAYQDAARTHRRGRHLLDNHVTVPWLEQHRLQVACFLAFPEVRSAT
jgi:hypothetical protein